MKEPRPSGKVTYDNSGRVVLVSMAVWARTTLAVWLGGWLRDEWWDQRRFGGCVFFMVIGWMSRRWHRSTVAG